MASGFRALANKFAGITTGARSQSLEDAALEYHDTAGRAGTLLAESYRAGLLADIPGLAKLIGRHLEPARLFKQFQGYEVNVGFLLSVSSSDSQPRDAAVTCGLLPQLLGDHPVFRRRTYQGKNADRQAFETELQRATEACKWLAGKIVAAGKAPSSTKSRSGKKSRTKAAAKGATKASTKGAGDSANKPLSRKTKTAAKGQAHLSAVRRQRGDKIKRAEK